MQEEITRDQLVKRSEELKKVMDELYRKYDIEYPRRIKDLRSEKDQCGDDYRRAVDEYQNLKTELLKYDITNSIEPLMYKYLVYIDIYIVGKNKIGFCKPSEDEIREYRIANNRSPHVEIYTFYLTGHEIFTTKDNDLKIKLKVNNLRKYFQGTSYYYDYEFSESVCKSDQNYLVIDDINRLYPIMECPRHFIRRMHEIEFSTSCIDESNSYVRFDMPCKYEGREGFKQNSYSDPIHGCYFIDLRWLQKQKDFI